MAIISPQDATSVRQFYEAGFTMQEIAEKLGVGIGAVLYCMRRHCIPRRSASEDARIRLEKNRYHSVFRNPVPHRKRN
jgi:predicted DNA-binding protein YlxM (UPF0122 family)